MALKARWQVIPEFDLQSLSMFAPLDYYLCGALKDKCYADKPETIDVLKDNIREAIGEIHR